MRWMQLRPPRKHKCSETKLTFMSTSACETQCLIEVTVFHRDRFWWCYWWFERSFTEHCCPHNCYPEVWLTPASQVVCFHQCRRKQSLYPFIIVTVNWIRTTTAPFLCYQCCRKSLNFIYIAMILSTLSRRLINSSLALESTTPQKLLCSTLLTDWLLA